VSLRPRPALAVGTALVLAAASLALPYLPVYDPWAWLIWGREVLQGHFETAAGPSWKPLPVLIDAPLSPLGDAAPQGWLLVARAGWICAPLLAGLLAARLSGEETGRWRWVAAAVAAGSVALTADSFTPPLRQFTGGLSEPLLVALVLGAIWAALDDRREWALGLGMAAALLRPECWPFLALWAYFASRERPHLRAAATAVAVLIPIAWFVPDILGAGNPLQGGETARAGGLEPLDGLAVLGRALAAPLAACWIGVALLLWRGDFVNRWFAKSPRGDRTLAILLAGAAAWILLVALMAVAGFAGLPRFLAPATAIVAVLGGVGIARTAAGCGRASSRHARQRSTAPPEWALRGVVTIALAIAVAGFAWRAAQVPGDLDVVQHRTRSVNHLFDLVEETGKTPLLACQHRVRMTRVREQTALAWKLEEPISTVPIHRRPKHGVALSTKPLPQGNVIAQAGTWQATVLPCPTGYARHPRPEEIHLNK
jgi:MFS family permease